MLSRMGTGRRPLGVPAVWRGSASHLNRAFMVSLPAHVIFSFDLNVVYTNMSGVTPSPPFSRLVFELLEGILLLFVTDVLLHHLPSTPQGVALSGVVCHLLVSIQYSAHYCREHGLTSAPRARSMTLSVRGAMVLSNSRTFVYKLIGNEISEILLLVRSHSVITGSLGVVDVKLVQLRPGFWGEVLIWLEGPIFFLQEPEPFDVIKDAIPMLDGSLYLVHVILLICLDVGNLAQDFLIVDWSVTWHKQFDFCYMECGVSSPFMG